MAISPCNLSAPTALEQALPLQWKDSKLRPLLPWFFSAGGLNHQLSRVINSGVRNDGLLNLNASDFFALKVPMPPLGEQERIAEIMSTATNELALLRDQFDALREQKKGVLQRIHETLLELSGGAPLPTSPLWGEETTPSAVGALSPPPEGEV